MKVREIPIAALPVSRAVFYDLVRDGCATLGDAVARPLLHWRTAQQMGPKLVAELAGVLAFYGVQGDDELPPWLSKAVRVPTVAELRQQMHGPSNERNEAVYRDRQSGMTLKAIGWCHGISRERVRQIVRVEQRRAERMAEFDRIHELLRLVPCETCGTEGRIYRQRAGSTHPDDEIDYGECPDCAGTGKVWTEVQPVERDDDRATR